MLLFKSYNEVISVTADASLLQSQPKWVVRGGAAGVAGVAMDLPIFWPEISVTVTSSIL